MAYLCRLFVILYLIFIYSNNYTTRKNNKNNDLNENKMTQYKVNSNKKKNYFLNTPPHIILVKLFLKTINHLEICKMYHASINQIIEFLKRT